MKIETVKERPWFIGSFNLCIFAFSVSCLVFFHSIYDRSLSVLQS